ncbi:unnamed protein product [Cuscuta epithymum]|uniref:PHD finger transcription factor n=1 Tax=Cuscuta epithymum TaxID=186058 RepID=A0AAV0FSM6_9ASTE|nr:unnamed protein product [Cuscuta epithymum]
MAADSGQQTITRVRKLSVPTNRKLCKGQKVEVRSNEDGFLGSWHPGTVVSLGSLTRRVKYDHILCEKRSTNLVERVKVSPLIDGVKPADWNPDPYRGMIRPFPPPLHVVNRTLHYGECVDFFYQDAWWEGVIFDHEDGSENRQVFFPDMGDEMTACVNKLRITQDWNEVSEEWKLRGSWIFLELVEEVAKKIPLLVSLKQIWYEVREKSEFKDWTFSDRSYWRGLVSLVLLDNFKPTITHFFSVLDYSQGFLQEGQSFDFSQQLLNDVLDSVDFTDDSLSLCLPWTFPHNISASNVQETLAKENAPKDFAPTIDNGRKVHCKSSEVSVDKIKHSKRRTKLKWTPIDLEAQYLPEAVAEFKNLYMSGSKAPDEVNENVRKHLLYIGWTVEFAIDKKSTRFRYIPPSGPSFMSLAQICKEMDIESHDTLSEYRRAQTKWSPILLQPKLFPEEVAEFKRLSLSNVRHRKDLYPKLRRHLLGLGWKIEHAVGLFKSKIRYVSPSGTSVYTLLNIFKDHQEALSVVSLHDQRSEDGKEEQSRPSMDEDIIIAPEFCPQAVNDYVLIMSPDPLSKKCKKTINEIADKAKKHLVFSNWKIYAICKGIDKKEVRYMSPDGRIFYSLVTACKHYLKENTCSASDASCPRGQSESTHVDVDHVQPGHSEVQRKRKLRELIRGEDVAKGSHSASRVLRSYKRARQVGPSSSHQTPRSVLSWLVENNVVPSSTRVQYREREDSPPKREGLISDSGIKCHCCQEIYGLSKFGAHAGSSDHCPSRNIFLDDGRSLLDCQVEMKHKLYAKKKEPKIKKGGQHNKINDYICSICHDGGQLILCDMCPSSFHPGCLGIEELPEGDWFCPFCCCGICGQSKDLLADNNAINCSQCEHQYHVGCVRNNGVPKNDSYPEGYWFCNTRCQQIFLGLHKLLGKPIHLGTNDLSWTLLKYKETEKSSLDAPEDEVSIENYSKLNVALGVMHECFEPIKESRTGRDLMEDIVFNRWSELSRLNFQGFYTVLLERNDELITVATLRVHGEKVAEVPFIATRFQYRRLGMCKILMNVLEKKLNELGVERLVLPAAKSVLDTWTSSFGFSVIQESERLDFLDFSILNFHGTVMCQKLLARKYMELTVFTGSTQHIFSTVNKYSSEVDGTSPVSEVVQADQNHRSVIMDQGPVDTPGGTLTSSKINQAPLLLTFKQTADAPDRKDGSTEVGFLKCYKRRKRLLSVEAQVLVHGEVTDG